ncbi:type IV secretory system conjugative DNA transfer family protein [Sulfitobacter mediterraneus]|uniref:type IV secretory system conjugative DNA transfer family protein n=1 Tax=Sulfitobacter mediterraneus TaxID=83219 RepID=UPI0019396FAC|nr:type IV secretory system conjugative DNA transfer family protein [Sulfitobacter mediterraneus]MBM1556241.1 type IV secretory system conjugative DNA transfer family protein [Sulfitobacter mediterraneus]MBM1567721.1 type IV secretory system conjugative DNA transfer family protein [Sulfitobacter mediterraneus]MBM1571595.1 type IV secretory system conjugative DNA transfer family protein [Sulfitobacter mediterraneus]MBM1575383.1 type IV secretory system conjugative DNA transfer family protein [Su
MSQNNDTGVIGLAVPATISYGVYAMLKSSGADPIYLYASGGVALTCGALALVKFVIETKHWIDLRRMLRAQGTYGTTRQLNDMTPEEIGLSTCNKDGDGIVLGAQSGQRGVQQLWPKLLYYKGDSHGLFSAGTGGGKTSSLAIPIRLSLGAHRNAIITAKGDDMCVALYRYLTEILHQEVHCVDPYRLLERHGIKSDDYNPCEGLVELADYRSPDLIEKARELVLTVLPEPSGTSDQNKLFRDNGREFLVWCLIYLAVEQAETGHLCCNLAYLNRVLSDGTDEVLRFFVRMTSCQDFDGEIARAGKRFLGKFKSTAKTAESFLTEAQTALQPYVPVSRIGKSVEHSTFNAADLKTKGKKMTIFIILPAEKSGVNDAYVGLCLNTLLTQAIQANSFEPRLTIIADEFEALSTGPLPIIERVLKIGRSRGVQLLAFIQAKSGGLEAKYKELAPMFESQSAIHMLWDVRSVKEAEEYSKRAGQRSIVTDSADANRGSLTVKEEGIPQLRLDQVIQRPKFQAVLFKENNAPMIVDLVHHKAVSPWNSQVDVVPGAPPEPDFKVRFKA